MQKEQIKSVLAVLRNIDKCICAGVDYLPGTAEAAHFRLHTTIGVCWHVQANTQEPEINIDFLCPVFEELGYANSKYPVESTVLPGAGEEVWFKYHSNTRCTRDMYSTDTPHGKVRHMLVEKLIAYFEKKLEIVLYYSAQVQ